MSGAELSPHRWGVHEARYSRADDRLQTLLSAQTAAKLAPPSLSNATAASQTPVRSNASGQQQTGPSAAAAQNSAEFLRSPLADRNRSTASVDPKMAALLNNEHEASPRLLESSRQHSKPYPALSKPIDRSISHFAAPPPRSPRTPMLWQEPTQELATRYDLASPTPRQQLSSPSLAVGGGNASSSRPSPAKQGGRTLSKPEQEVSRLLYGSASIASTPSLSVTISVGVYLCVFLYVSPVYR